MCQTSEIAIPAQFLVNDLRDVSGVEPERPANMHLAVGAPNLIVSVTAMGAYVRDGVLAAFREVVDIVGLQ